MTKFAAMLVVTAMACGTTKDPVGPETGPKPRTQTTHAADVPSDEGTAEPEQILTLVHWWSRGPMTVVKVEDNRGAYQLRVWHSRHRRWSTSPVAASGEAQLRAVLETLEPSKLAETDPCRIHVRDGTAWSVRSRRDGKRIDRVRQFNPQGAGSCAAFQEAALGLMHLAGLRCSTTGCVSDDDADGNAPAP
jgi:hypothetical protein